MVSTNPSKLEAENESSGLTEKIDKDLRSRNHIELDKIKLALKDLTDGMTDVIKSLNLKNIKSLEDLNVERVRIIQMRLNNITPSEEILEDMNTIETKEEFIVLQKKYSKRLNKLVDSIKEF